MYPVCPVYLMYSIYKTCPIYQQQYMQNNIYNQPLGITPANNPNSTDEVNKALLNPIEFQKFKQNPKEYLKSFNLTIDEDISGKLADKLKGFNSIQEIGSTSGFGGIEQPPETLQTTAWAIASPAYSIATTKIAVII